MQVMLKLALKVVKKYPHSFLKVIGQILIKINTLVLKFKLCLKYESKTQER